MKNEIIGKLILVFLIVSLFLIVVYTQSYAGWVVCPEDGKMVTIKFKSPLPERGIYEEKITYTEAIQDHGERYTRHSYVTNMYLRLWDATPCLGRYQIAYEYGAEILSIDIDGVELTLDPNTNNSLVTEWDN